MTSKDISLLCNYTESATPINPLSKIMFIDMNGDMDEQYLREIKKKNRGLAIDAVLEDKVEEYNNRDRSTSWPPNEEYSSTGTVSAMVHSMSLSNPNKFQSYEEIWDRLINHFELNTQSDHHYLSTTNITQLSYQKDSSLTEEENSSKFSRKLLSRIMMISNMITSHLSRRGPATFMIIGTDVVPLVMNGLSHLFTSPQKQESNRYVLGNLSGITVIVSDKIKSNKVIIGRSESNQDGGGLIVMNDMNKYYMTETPHTFYKKFAWFEII